MSMSVSNWMHGRLIASIAIGIAVVITACLAHHWAYRSSNAAGRFTTSSQKLATVVSAVAGEVVATGYVTTELSWPSGLSVVRGKTYIAELRSNGDWFDQTLRTDVAGLATDNLKHVIVFPLLRRWDGRWFQPLLKVGATGDDEYLMWPTTPDRVDYPAYAGPDVDGLSPIDPKVAADILAHTTIHGPKTASVRFTALNDGELHVYVNDALPMVGARHDLFYRNNSGSGSLAVREIVGKTSAP